MKENKGGNSRLFALVMIVIVIAVVVFIFLFNSKSDPTVGVNPDIQSESAVSVTETAFETTTEVTQSEPPSSASQEDLDFDFSVFDNSVFLGNSRVLALGNYDIAKNVYAKVGLTVSTVFTDKAEGSSVPVIEELNGKNYERVFLMFGDNECGWGSMDTFINQYVKLIGKVREKCPGAKVYLLSCLPISKECSDKNVYQYNSKNIEKINGIIKTIAEEQNCSYIDCASSVKGSDGYLPDNYSKDGTHLYKEFDLIWARHVAENM